MDAHKLEHLFSMLSCQPPACISWEDAAPAGAVMPPEGRHACIINYLRMAWTQGRTTCFDGKSPCCRGGWTYMGYALPPSEAIARFVTTGEGGREGERYLPHPESMMRYFRELDIRPAPAPFCVIRPFSAAEGEIALYAFHGRPEELSGLCMLAWFALDDHEAVAMPFGSGCSNIFSWPAHYQARGRNKAVLGGMDPSCRPFMGVDELTFTVTPEVLRLMLEAAPRSFLMGGTWGGVKKKIGKSRLAWEK